MRIGCVVLTFTILTSFLTNSQAQPPRGFDEGSGQIIPPELLDARDGVAKIPDRATFKKLSYQGPEVLIDRHLKGIEFVKIQIEKTDTKDPYFYFINTKTHRGHPMFMRVIGSSRDNRSTTMRGVLVYRPLMKSKSGQAGVYTFEFEPNDSYSPEKIQLAYDLLIKNCPMLKRQLGYYLMPAALRRYEREKKDYDALPFPIYRPEDVYADIGYLPLNLAEGYGRLRLMNVDERPTARDVVLYKSLPNEMPRVAGIITGARQTPLSHVNLRAIQDKVPNAFISEAWKNDKIKSLLNKYVYYKVAADGYAIREAKQEEVTAHFAKIRPEKTQTPKRDLSIKIIRPLKEVAFKDSVNVGVKAANVASMKKFDLPKDAVPDGHAIPFYFYDEFMKHNGFYDQAKAMLRNTGFWENRDTQAAKLKEFRALIKQGKMPTWMMDALEAVHKKYPEGQSLRCRSSTNNEDLPGFSGAGLYSSYTHKQSEGHLSKSIKQVYASLWNFRAFDEREFYRVDHFTTAMGVLVHPNFKDELVNGVAVTDDVLYQTQSNYYVNSQVGEDLVTNPEEQSIPEEILLNWWSANRVQVMRHSNRAKGNKRLLDTEQLEELRGYLSEVHAQFAKLYGLTLNAKNFAMEVEFKITKEGTLVVKQARPWVYASTNTSGGK